MKKKGYLMSIAWVGLALIGLFLLKIIFLPSDYRNLNWFQPAGNEMILGKYDFARYELPPSYRLITFRHDERYRHGLLVFENRLTGQQLVLSVLRGFEKVAFDQVAIRDDDPHQPFWGAVQHPVKGSRFSIWDYLPFGWRDDYEHSGKDLTLKGVSRIKANNEFQTASSDIKWIEGSFDKIEFAKTSNTVRPFVSSVFDFGGGMQGAVAILNMKKSGFTVFAIGASKSNSQFNKNEFSEIVKSINSDAVPFAQAQINFSNETKIMREKQMDLKARAEAIQKYLAAY